MKLRYYQEEAVNNTLRSIQLNHNPLVILPTGSGKTPVIAELVRRTLPTGRHVIILSHVKEILEQNYSTIKNFCICGLGIYSSMLNRREVREVTVAGIQSVYKKPDIFYDDPLIIIDEAHTINTEEEETMYNQFFKGIGEHTRVGLTATPYRTGSGYIYGEGKPFDIVTADWSTGDKFIKLIDDGFLCKLTTKRTKAEMDTTGIKVVGGDYSEKDLSDRFDREAITANIVKEIIAAGRNRKKWLIFAIDINHAEHIAEILIRSGIPTAPVHSKMNINGFDRNVTVNKYRNNKYRCAVTVNVLSTGYDDPEIDLIAVVRPTQSPIFHVQGNGRGSRIFKGKKDCLVLDFAGNTARLGPINDPKIYIRGKGAGSGEPITKDCPICDSIVHASARKCQDCGYEFPIQHKLEQSASTDKIIEDGKAHWLHVDDVEYSIKRGYGTPNSFIATYICGNLEIPDWVFIEHRGYAKHKADHWVKFRGGRPCKTAQELMNQKSRLKKPRKILAQKKGKYYIISDAIFPTETV